MRGLVCRTVSTVSLPLLRFSWTEVFDPDGVECCEISFQIVQRVPSSYANYTNVTQPMVIPTEYARRRSYTYPVQLQTGQEYTVALVATNAARQYSYKTTRVNVREACSPPTP